MKLKCLIKKYSNIVLYLSAGFDFHVLYDLNKLNKLDNTLVIFLEIYPDIYSTSLIFKSSNYILEDIFSNKITIKDIKLIDKLDLIIDKRLYNLNESKYLNNVYYMNASYNVQEESIDNDIVYVVSENASFVLDYLIKNSIKIDTIYIKGIRGSNVNCAFLNKVIDRLSTKEIITNNHNILNKIDLNVEEVYPYLKQLKPNIFSSNMIKDIPGFILIDTKEKQTLVEYEILDKNKLCINISNNIFEIDFFKFKSEFNTDISINGFEFKKNSSKNVIGLDLINFFGLHIENNKLIFLSIKPNKSINKYKIYDNSLFMYNNKLIRTQSATIALESLVGLKIEELGLEEYINYQDIEDFDIKGEYV